MTRPRCYQLFAAILLAVASQLCVANSIEEGAFFKRVEQRIAQYENLAQSDDHKTLYVTGNYRRAVDELINLVPDEKKEAADYFILGNMLYVIDPTKSYEFMLEAEKRQPDQALIKLERGIHEHRRSNFESAKAYYLAFHESAEPTPATAAYLSHTYLMTGQPETALDIWQQARFDQNHTAIEKSMYPIFSPINQEKDRAEKIAAIQSGDTAKLCDLWRLDNNWEFDWWNRGNRTDYLAFDQSLADQLIEENTVEAAHFDLCQRIDEMSIEDLSAELQSLGITAGDKQLPPSAALNYAILEKLISNQRVTPSAFLATYEAQIKESAEAHPDEQLFWDILAFLYANTHNTHLLQEVDAHGWHHLKIEKFAASYVAGLDPASSEYQSQLQAALSEFPNSPTLNQFAYVDDPTRPKDKLARFVASQFSDVKNNYAARYRLSSYMASLAHELNKKEEKNKSDE